MPRMTPQPSEQPWDVTVLEPHHPHDELKQFSEVGISTELSSENATHKALDSET